MGFFSAEVFQDKQRDNWFSHDRVCKAYKAIIRFDIVATKNKNNRRRFMNKTPLAKQRIKDL